MAAVDTPTAHAVLLRLTEPSDLLDHLVVQVPRDEELSLRADPSPDVVRDIVKAGGKRAKSLLSQLRDIDLANTIAQSEHRLGMLRALALRGDLTTASQDRLFELGIEKQWDLLHNDLLSRMTPVERLPKLLELIERGAPPRDWQEQLITLHNNVAQTAGGLEGVVERYLHLPPPTAGLVAKAWRPRREGEASVSLDAAKALLAHVEPHLPISTVEGSVDWRDLSGLRNSVISKTIEAGRWAEFVELANRYGQDCANPVDEFLTSSPDAASQAAFIDSFEKLSPSVSVTIFLWLYGVSDTFLEEKFSDFELQVPLVRRYLAASDELKAKGEKVEIRSYWSYGSKLRTMSDPALELLTGAEDEGIASMASKQLERRIPPLREQLGEDGFQEWLKTAPSQELATQQLGNDDWLTLARNNPAVTPSLVAGGVRWEQLSHKDRRWLLEEFLDDTAVADLLASRRLDRSDFVVLMAQLRGSNPDSWSLTKTHIAHQLFQSWTRGLPLCNSEAILIEQMSDAELIIFLRSVQGKELVHTMSWFTQVLSSSTVETVDLAVRLIEQLRECDQEHPLVASVGDVAAQLVTTSTEEWKTSKLGSLLTTTPLASLTRSSGVKTDSIYAWIVPQMQERFGTCVDRWDIALNLLPEWQGTLDELFEVVDNVI